MTEDRLPLAELLEKAGDGDFLRAVAEAVLQILMETDVEGLIGAGRHERPADRLNSATAIENAHSTVASVSCSDASRSRAKCPISHRSSSPGR